MVKEREQVKAIIKRLSEVAEATSAGKAMGQGDLKALLEALSLLQHQVEEIQREVMPTESMIDPRDSYPQRIGG